jgi:hypothetical protein
MEAGRSPPATATVVAVRGGEVRRWRSGSGEWEGGFLRRVEGGDRGSALFSLFFLLVLLGLFCFVQTPKKKMNINFKVFFVLVHHLWQKKKLGWRIWYP